MGRTAPNCSGGHLESKPRLLEPQGKQPGIVNTCPDISADISISERFGVVSSAPKIVREALERSHTCLTRVRTH